MDTVYLSLFNEQFMEFIGDISAVFPENMDIRMAKTVFQLIQTTNPKLIITIFRDQVIGPYKTQIEEGNIEFFVTKNYQQDLEKTQTNNSSKILEAIERLREPVRMMSPSNQKKVIQYLQNLQKISDFYFAEEEEEK